MNDHDSPRDPQADPGPEDADLSSEEWSAPEANPGPASGEDREDWETPVANPGPATDEGREDWETPDANPGPREVPDPGDR